MVASSPIGGLVLRIVKIHEHQKQEKETVIFVFVLRFRFSVLLLWICFAFYVFFFFELPKFPGASQRREGSDRVLNGRHRQRIETHRRRFGNSFPLATGQGFGYL